jgi:cell fate (sporulation/competence/biofilm development) regulator YlbF (YheA/YmcA/DUF963 family)
MEVLPVFNLTTTHEKVEQAATQLGDLLHDQPPYQAYKRSLTDLEQDAQVRELSVQIQKQRNTLYGGERSPELAAELQRLELELEDTPAVQAYRAAERDMRSLLMAVNTLLSETLKVDFAANAKRGCGCGG